MSYIYKLNKFLPCLLIVLYLSGCGAAALVMKPPVKPVKPSEPAPPKANWKTAQEIIISSIKLDSHKDENIEVAKADTIAIMEFKEPPGSGAGLLVADQFILELQRMGYRVIEREQIQKIMREHGLIGITKLSELEIAKRLGELLHADFFMFGAVTQYGAENRNIATSKVIPETEKTKYQKACKEYKQAMQKYSEDYTKYKNEFSTYKLITGQPATQTPSETQEGNHIKLKTIEEWEEEYSNTTKDIFTSIASVGLTAKMVEVKSSKIVWVGQANVSDERLQDGMKRIVNSMITDFLKK